MTEGVYHFKLYLIPGAPACEDALAKVNAYLGQSLPAGSYRLEIIDASKDRAQVAAADILIVPALVRVKPSPELRLIAELSDAKKIAAALRLPTKTRL